MLALLLVARVVCGCCVWGEVKGKTVLKSVLCIEWIAREQP